MRKFVTFLLVLIPILLLWVFVGEPYLFNSLNDQDPNEQFSGLRGRYQSERAKKEAEEMEGHVRAKHNVRNQNKILAPRLQKKIDCHRSMLAGTGNIFDRSYKLCDGFALRDAQGNMIDSLSTPKGRKLPLTTECPNKRVRIKPLAYKPFVFANIQFFGDEKPQFRFSNLPVVTICPSKRAYWEHYKPHIKSAVDRLQLALEPVRRGADGALVVKAIIRNGSPYELSVSMMSCSYESSFSLSSQQVEIHSNRACLKNHPSSFKIPAGGELHRSFVLKRKKQKPITTEVLFQSSLSLMSSMRKYNSSPDFWGQNFTLRSKPLLIK